MQAVDWKDVSEMTDYVSSATANFLSFSYRQTSSLWPTRRFDSRYIVGSTSWQEVLPTMSQNVS